MKRIIPFLLFFSFAFNGYSGGGGGCDMNIVPASHPDACVAIALENFDASGTHTWSFTPSVVDASTGNTVSSINVTSGGAVPIVYWTGTGDKEICYDGCCETVHSCDCNPIASDDFEDAPLICNTDVYCGTTLGSYTVDQEALVDPVHTGSLENNSWLQFIASSSSVVFDIDVAGSCEMQFAVYELNTSAGGTSFTLFTDIDWTSTDGFSGSQTINATGLTPGLQYYIHLDGDGGQICDYEVQFQSGIQTLSAAASNATVCAGDPTTITVTPSDPSATYTWTDNQGGGPYPNSPDITVNPSVTTIYSVEVVGGACYANDNIDVTVTVDPGCAPCASPPTVNLSSSIGTTCVSDPIAVNGNTFGGSATSVTITENGAGSVSPTSSGTSPFGFTYTPAAGDAGGTVTITVTTDNPDGAPCVEDVETYTLNVTAEATPTFTQVPDICNGDALAALPTTSDNGINGTWSPSVDNTTTTLYTFTPTAGQCATTATMTITVNSPVTPTFTQVPDICSGDALSALPTTSDNGYTGTWSPAVDNTTTTLYTFTPTAGQCATTATMTITVDPQITPTFTQVPAICNGEALSALPTTSDNGYTGTWSPAVDNTNTTLYTFTPTAGQCATTTAMTITVNPKPQAFDQTPQVCEDFGTPGVSTGADLTVLNSTIDGGAGNTVTWFSDAGLTTPVIPDNNVTLNNNDVFYALVSNGSCADTAMITYTVTSPGTPVDPMPQICEDAAGSGSVANVDLTTYNGAVYAGGGTLTWYQDAGLTAPVGDPTDTTVTDGMVVYADVIDGLCTINTPVTFTVNPLPTVTDLTPSVCEDAGTPLTTAGVNLTGLNGSIDGGAGSSMTWYNDTLLTSPVATPTSVTVTDGQVFYVEVDNGTCITIAKVTYTVTSTIVLTNPAPVLCEDLPAGSGIAIVDLDTYNTAVYSGAGATYVWYQDAGLTVVVGSPNSASITGPTMTFYVDVTDGTCNNNTAVTFTVNPQSVGTVNTTICATDSVVVNGNTYNAANPNGTEVFTSANNCDSTVTVALNVLPALTGVHTETVCDGGSIVVNGTTYNASNLTGTEVFTVGPNNCDSTVTVTLTVLPVLTGVHTETVCDGGSIVVNGTTYDATNLTGTEIFTVGPNNCDSTVTVTLTVLPVLTGVHTETVCDGGSIVVNGTTYDAANPTGTEVFTVGPNNCDSTVAVTLTVLPALTGSVTNTICATESVVVNGTTYDASNPSGVEVFTNVGPNNCDSTVTVNLTINGGVVADFTATPNSGFVPLDVTFDASGSSSGAGITYVWDFGDGTGGIGSNPSHTYADINTFTATLIVSDGSSCPPAEHSVTIEVIGESSILIPNVFTPNKDGSNDVFTVSGTNLSEVNCVIFNRWGQKLYEWDRVKGSWDGRTQAGEECPDGTYFYIVKAKGNDGSEYFKKGGFSLIR